MPLDVCPAYKVVEDVLRELAPDEVSYLPQVWGAFLEDPEASSGGEELLGYGELAAELTLWASLLGPVIRDLLVSLAADGIIKIGPVVRRSWRERRRRRKQARELLTSTAPLPALDDAQVEQASKQIYAAAVGSGRSPEQSEELARVVILIYRRHAGGSPGAAGPVVPDGSPESS
ncbi:MAG TPA: hypothetical protein VFP72_10390 [Kineosporiaceae bacterium]|nr:hypothetical protein [Kineosporiaceae bacterium]